MKKYYWVARAEWLDAIQNYQEVLLWIVIQSVPIIGVSALWVSSGSNLSGSQINTLVTYYIAIFIIDRLTSFYFENRMQEDIKNGELSKYLLKPIGLHKFLISDNIGGKTFNTLFLLLPVITIIFFAFSKYIIFPSFINIFLFTISLLLAFFLQFSIAYIIASCAFFIEQAFSISHFHWMLDAVAGGYMFPLIFYPQYIRTIFEYLPFAYVYYFPASILTNTLTISDSVFRLLVSLIWAIILYIFSQKFYQLGVKKYSSSGN